MDACISSKRTIAARAAGIAATAFTAVATLSACSSSSPTGAPSCSDTSAAGKRLAHGCKHDGKTYPAIAEHCIDHTTLYNVPSAPGGGASGYSNGKLRTRAVTTEELTRCISG